MKPTFAYTGSTDSAFAQQLTSSVTLVPYRGSSKNHATGLILDGDSPQFATSDSFRSVLDGGQVLILNSPTSSQMKVLKQFLGLAPEGSPAMVLLRKRVSRKGYSCVVVPMGVPLQASSSYREGNGTPVSSAPTSYLSPIDRARPVLDAASGDLFNVDAAPLPATYIPPSQAIAGYDSITLDWRYALVDPRGGTTTQAYDYSETYWLIVYWQNATPNPSYTAIVRQTGTVSAGTLLENDRYGAVLPSAQFTVGPLALVPQGSTSPFTTGVNLVDYSPKTSSPGPAAVSISPAVTVWGDIPGGGTGPSTFNPGEPAGTSFLDNTWSVLDQTMALSPQWLTYQSSVWNSYSIPYGSSEMYDLLFTGGGHVRPVPTLSSGTIPFTFDAVWQVNPPLFTPPTGAPPFTNPPSCPLAVSSNIYWLAYAAWRIANHNTEHIYGVEEPTAQYTPFSCDLQTIVNYNSWGTN